MHTMNTQQSNIPKWLPSHAQDWFQYGSGYTASNQQIQAVLEIEGHLDIELLNRAIRLSVDAEPVLGCRFIEDPHHPYWNRRDDLDEVVWCTLLESVDPKGTVQEYLEQPIGNDDPQVQALLVRSEQHDILCMKVNHTSCDGAAVKEYIRLLAGIYTVLTLNPDYYPPLNARGKRGQDGLFLDLGMIDYRSGFDPHVAALEPTWAFPYREGEDFEPKVQMMQLDAAAWTKVKSLCESTGCTINDAIVAAYVRALYRIIKPSGSEPMEIMVTIDLRKYLHGQKAEALCNLSGAMNVRVALENDEHFQTSLGKVHAVTKSLKSKLPGIHSAVSMEMIAELGFEEMLQMFKGLREAAVSTRKASPILSNFGLVSVDPVCFGSIQASDAYLVSPALFAPAFMLGLSSYKDRATFTVSYYRSTVATEDVKQLLQFIHDELNHQ